MILFEYQTLISYINNGIIQHNTGAIDAKKFGINKFICIFYNSQDNEYYIVFNGFNTIESIPLTINIKDVYEEKMETVNTLFIAANNELLEDIKKIKMNQKN